MRRNLQRIGDILQDVGGGTVQPPLDLAEIRVGDLGQGGQLPERQVRDLALYEGRAPGLNEKMLDWAWNNYFTGS